MTDTPTPAPVDLTPEVLARWEELAGKAPQRLRHAVMRWEDDGGDIEAIIWHDFAEPLLSGVRSRDARIAELEQRAAEAEAVIAEALSLLISWPETKVYLVRDLLSGHQAQGRPRVADPMPSECGDFHYGRPGETILHECTLPYGHDGEHQYRAGADHE